jgi:hypothetical protein
MQKIKKPRSRAIKITSAEHRILKNSVIDLFLLCSTAFRPGTPERQKAYRAMQPASQILGGVV